MLTDQPGTSLDTDLLQGFYLGDLFISPRDGQVSGRSGSVHLPPTAMEVLLCLAASPGDLVTRETLIASVWGEGGGSSEALNHAVSEIRHALDDHHDHPGFVQTLPRRGYRLLVKPVPGSAHAGSMVLGVQSGTSVDQIGLLENLKQRGVLETGIAYLVLGWLLIQVADIVFAQLLLPAWLSTFVTVLVIAGFPIAVALSWFLEFRDGRAIVHELSPRDAIRRRFSRTYISVVGALVIASVVVFVYDRSVGLPQTDIQAVRVGDASDLLPPVQDNSIAALPFLNVDGSEETQIFANGLADDLITRLSRVPGLRVASRGDSSTLDPHSPSARVRDRLRVAKYLEGSVQIDGGTMRVVVQLIDSASGFHLLSRTFDRPVAGFFDMRDEITALTVATVRVALPPDTRPASESLGADPSIDVYKLYRRGIDASRLPRSPETFETALRWFDAALEIDPEYAAAHAGKCAALVDGYPVTDDPAYIDAAEASCATALGLNPNLDVVYTALGDLYRVTGRYDDAERAYLAALGINTASTASLKGLGDVYRRQQRNDEAEESLRQAAGLQPGDWAPYNALGTFLYRSGRYAEAADQYRIVVTLDVSNVRGHTNLGSALMLAGEFVEAEPVFRRAIDLDPGVGTYSNLGLLLYYLGRFEEAVEAHRNAVGLQPQDYLAKSNLGDALWVAGRTGEALEVFTMARELASGALAVNPNDAFTLMDLAWINAVLGEAGTAIELIDRSRALVPDDPYVHYIHGLILNNGGDGSAALTALETAVANGYSPQLLAADPNLAGLRDEPRFLAMLNMTNSR